MRRGQHRIESQRAVQLFGGGRGVTLRQVNPAEQHVHGRVVRLHAAGLLGCGARGVEILGEQRALGFRDELGELARRTRAAALRRARVDEHDHAGAFEAEQRLGHFEVRAPQLRREASDGALTIDEREHLPLRREEIELPAPAFRRRRERRHDADVRDTVFDPRPLVDAARPFHEQRLDGNPDGELRRDFAFRLLREREIAFVPAHHFEDDFLDLEPHLPLDFPLRDHAEGHENFAQAPLVALALLHVARALEIGLGDFAGAEEQRAQRVRIAADLR